MSSAPFDEQGSASEADLASALVARVHALEDIVRTTTQVVDEKTLKELRRTVEALAKRDPKFEERVTNKVDVLADRVETVAKTVSTASAAVAANDGTIAKLRRELETSFSGINAALAETGQSADAMELVEVKRALDELTKLSKQRMPRGLEARIDELQAKFTLVAQRVDSVSSTISTTAAGLAGRDGDVNALRRAFEAGSDHIEAELAELRRDIDPTAVPELRQELKELAHETSREQRAGRELDRPDRSQARFAHRAVRIARSVGDGHRCAPCSGRGGPHGIPDVPQRRERSDECPARRAQTTLAAFSSKVDALEHAGVEAARAVEQRVLDVDGKLDRLAAEVESATRRSELKDADLEALELRFQEASTASTSSSQSSPELCRTFPSPASIEQAFAARIDEVAERTSSLADDVARVEASGLEQARAAASSSAALERLRAEEGAVLTESLGPDRRARDLGGLDGRQRHRLRRGGLGTRCTDCRPRAGVSHGGPRARGASHLHERQARRRRGPARFSREHRNVDGHQGLRDGGRRLCAPYVRRGRGCASDFAPHGDQAVAIELDARASSLEQDDATAQSALASHELAERVDGLDASLRAAGEERAVNASEIARVAAILEVERASLRTKVDALVSAAQASATAPDAVELERRVTRLTSRVESLDGDRASAQAQFDAIANALASTPHDSTLEQRLDELARRIDAVEQHGAAVASKVSHTNALLPTALRSLEARLDDVAPGTRTAGRELGAEDPHDAQPDEADETSEALDAADRATATVVPLRTGDP